MFSIVIMPMVRLILVLNKPFLSICHVWFLCNNVISIFDNLSFEFNWETSESVIKTLCSDVVLEPLIWHTNPFVTNHVLVESFEQSGASNSNWAETLLVGIPNPLLFSVWLFSAWPFRKVDVVDTSVLWCVLVSFVDSQSHLMSSIICACWKNIEWVAWIEIFKMVWFEVFWFCSTLE